MYITAALMIGILLIIKESIGIKLFNLSFIIVIIGSGIRTVKRYGKEGYHPIRLKKVTII